MGNSVGSGGSGGRHQRHTIDPANIEHLRILEEGLFAKVYKGRLVVAAGAASSDPVDVSIKVPRLPEHVRRNKKLMDVRLAEVRDALMPTIRRKDLARGGGDGVNIVRYLGMSFDDFRKEIWLVRDFVDGLDLETLMKNPSLCPALRSPEKRMGVSVGIARGILFLHGLRHPLVHGDFKPSDVLVPAGNLVQPKITNYGLWNFKKCFAEHSTPENAEADFMVNPWQAPEVYLGEAGPSLASDVWSLASTLLQWLTEQPAPWDLDQLCVRFGMRHNRRMRALMKAMRDGETPTVLKCLSDEDARQLVVLRDSLEYQPEYRPSARDVFEELSALSSTPTWTNVAFKRYYGDS